MESVEAAQKNVGPPPDAQSVPSDEVRRTVSLALSPESRTRSYPTGLLNATKGNSPFTVDDDSDPLALVYSTPANQPLSLARRTYGTESLFQYYALRGYKEIVGEAASPETAEAVQACLRDDTMVAAGSGMAAVTAHHRFGSKSTAPSRDSHVIDRCLVSTAAAATPPAVSLVALGAEGLVNSVVPLYVPLRPAQAQDATSLYRTNQVNEMRAAVEEERRERLRLVPEAAVYLSRYYPEGTDIAGRVQLPPPVEPEPATNTATPTRSGGRAGGPTSNTSTNAPTVSAGTATRNAAHHSGTSMQTAPTGCTRYPSNLASCRSSSYLKNNNSLSPSTLPLLLRAPQEVAATMQAQKEERRTLADHIEDAFVNAYHLRNPLAVERQRERERQASQAHSLKAAAALLADKGSGAAATRRSTPAASKKTSGKKKKTRAKAVAPPKREGGVPANLDVFRTSLLLTCNDEGAVTLEKLGVLLANVPFHVGTPTSVLAADSTSTVQRLFSIVYNNTRATNAGDVPEVLCTATSASGAGAGDLLSRIGNMMSDNSASNVTHGHRTSLSRVSCSVTGTRGGPRTSITQTTLDRANHSFVSVHSHASNTNAMSTTKGVGDGTVTASNGVHSPSLHHLTSALGHSWKDTIGSGANGKQPLPLKLSSDLNDGKKCVLVLEVLDALDALLNSVDTKRVVRWECFNVLALEGNGYIHKSQLVKLRQHAYRDGSVAEEQAAVTAAMVKTLSDVFAVVATEEEEAYLKANRKGKKKKRAVTLAAHQSSPIPLNVMRKSHMDYATFCRFFDEMPLMAAAFAHVWLPLLLSGHRHTVSADGSAGEPLDATKSFTTSNLQNLREGTPILAPPSPGPRADIADNRKEEEESFSSPASPRRPPRWVAPGLDDNPDALPLEALGSTPDARRAAVRKLVIIRQEQLHQACDAAEEEKLLMMQSEEPEGNGVFAGS
ncbi:hypothetical protein JKF63_05592 [Porcisia hertigi]|uniref:Uncharacterized protein n=1 Tax=Porcisia hertigi TaxID=2761500 RepID=A0A836LHR9_9TRYP|nr:hypothetical protein JKF63_05592 [Porcisia hertigi]